MNGFGLSVWYLSLENHSTTTTPTLKFPLLVLYEPREPHPEERNAIDGVASSNWKNGYTIWTFHWQWCCSTKNITTGAFIGNNAAERFQRWTAGCWWSWDVMSVLDVIASVKSSVTVSQNALGSYWRAVPKDTCNTNSHESWTSGVVWKLSSL